jgi:hypothetical protein
MGILRPIVPKKSFVDFIGLFFALVLIFGVAIFAFILYNTYQQNVKDGLNTALTHSTPVDANANVTKILEQTGDGIGMLNPLFPLLLVGIVGYIMLLAFMSRSHPAFLFIGLVVLAVAIIAAVTFSNVFESISAKPQFAQTASEFGVINVIMDNLPIVILILFIAIAMVLYALRSGPPAGGAY